MNKNYIQIMQLLSGNKKPIRDYKFVHCNSKNLFDELYSRTYWDLDEKREMIQLILNNDEEIDNYMKEKEKIRAKYESEKHINVRKSDFEETRDLLNSDDNLSDLLKKSRSYLEDTVMIEPFTILTNKYFRNERYVLVENKQNCFNFYLIQVSDNGYINLLFTINKDDFKSYWPTISDLNNKYEKQVHEYEENNESFEDILKQKVDYVVKNNFIPKINSPQIQNNNKVIRFDFLKNDETSIEITNILENANNLRKFMKECNNDTNNNF